MTKTPSPAMLDKAVDNMERMIASGIDFAYAQWKTSWLYKIDADTLAQAYDARSAS